MSQDLQTDLTVRRAGQPAGEAPLLVFLHGLTDSGSGWPSAERHWGSTYSILTLDQRGHGTSPRFTPEQLATHPGEVMVADAIGILEQLDAPPILIGHSLGGAVALTAAVRRPELVRALVLEDPAPLGPDDLQQDRSRGEEFAAGVRQSLASRDDEDLLRIRREQHPDWAEDELLVSGVAEQQIDLDYLVHGDFKPVTRWPELFAGLSVPTLVVSGDDMSEVCVTERMEERIGDIANPHVRVVRVAGAGHCIRREQPAAYYAAVDAFLAKHAAG
ncbi:MAG TPA: alpha/beta fold hydrolase [Nocardioidaceae bacterium]|nr:alpha/beta fold hydrolase [Nocardioidaceae bacterium]